MFVSNTQMSGLVFALTLAVAALAGGDASAREWSVGTNGKPVEAKLVGFDGQRVLLMSWSGKKKIVPVSKLNAEDEKFLKESVANRKTERLARMQEQMLLEHRIAAGSRNPRLWTVSIVAHNGARMNRTYFARNSRQAQLNATKEFPNAKMVIARRASNRT